MVKVLSFRFQHCFGLLTMLLVEGFSETGLFRHLSNHVFRSPVSSKMHQLSLPSFYWTCSKFILNLENAKKSSENIFRSLHNSIWKCCNKLPLLRREYLSSAVNGLTNSPKILHITQRDFFNLNYIQRDQKIWLRHCRSALNSVSAVYHVSCRSILWKGTF